MNFSDGRIRRRLLVTAVAVIVVAAALVFWRVHPRSITVTEGKFPEELVYVRSKDDVVNAGVMFTPSTSSRKPVAIIWIHGWGVNFYYPTYVMIGRALAARGYTVIDGNTRMHDIGTIEGERSGARVRGGGYWGIPSQEVEDLAAWVDFAERQGFRCVVLVGHSAGWAAVRAYQAKTQDPRVVGVVLASGAVRAETRTPDPQQLAEAKHLVAIGRGEDLVRIPHRSFPSFISAATFLDIANGTPEFRDFFGTQVQTQNPGVMRIRCPLLAFFGTREAEVGTAADLNLLTSSIHRQRTGPSRVDTAMIQQADHMYTGEEEQVAVTIARWADTLWAQKAQSTPAASNSGGVERMIGPGYVAR